MIKPRRLPFDRIARRYQTVNTILSFGLDSLWRNNLLRSLQLTGGMSVLDVGVGTGDLLGRIKTDGIVKIGVDPEPEMMRYRADLVYHRVMAIGEHIPLHDCSVDRIVSAFVLRNLTDRSATFSEIHRVMKHSGSGAILEMSPPAGGIIGMGAEWYIKHYVPLVGTLVSGDRAAYKYLSSSVMAFPQPEVIADELRSAGFPEVTHRRLSGGVTVLYTFRKE